MKAPNSHRSITKERAPEEKILPFSSSLENTHIADKKTGCGGIFASTPEKWKFSASRNDPYAATAVNVAFTNRQEKIPVQRAQQPQRHR